MNTNMNKPFELKVIVEFSEEIWEDCRGCAFHRVDNCLDYKCMGGVFKVIGVVEERKEEE